MREEGIKDKIYGIEVLTKEDISTLVAMITTLHGNLQTKDSSGWLYASCTKCSNIYPKTDKASV